MRSIIFNDDAIFCHTAGDPSIEIRAQAQLGLRLFARHPFATWRLNAHPQLKFFPDLVFRFPDERIPLRKLAEIGENFPDFTHFQNQNHTAPP